MKRLLLPLSATFLFSGLANAFVISDIRLEGLQRISAGTVFNALPFTIGDEVSNEERIAEMIRVLYRTGYFHDIHIGRDGDILIITLEERPSISKIKIAGNKAIREEDLLKGLKQAGLAEGEIFQKATLEVIRLELEKQYMAQGRYNAAISSKTEQLPRNQVAITIDIAEGTVSNINHVNIVGNTAFSREELASLFQLGKSGVWSWYTGNDKYSRERLSGDLERLRSWYLDRGYIHFNIESTQVAINPDKSGVYITVNITEGSQYRVNEVKLAGDLILPESKIRSLLQIKTGDIFSRRLLAGTETNIKRSLGEQGYIFSSINSVPNINDKDKTVDIAFFIDPAKRTYVRRVDFVGNTKTADEVLRREMRQLEGGIASTARIEQSKLRLNRLGFFKEVKVETTPIPGASDLVDVLFTVEEQPSGSITASVGYSQGDGLLLGGSINQSNFMGTGNHVAFSANSSSYRELYNFSYTNPFYTVDGVSRGFGLYYSQADYDETDITNYNVDNMGTSVNFGYPLSETSSLSFGFNIEKSSIHEATDSAYVVRDFLAANGNEFINWQASLGWSQSALNHGLLPTKGFSQGLSLNATLPGSDLFLYKLNYRGQFFVPFTDSLSLRFHGRLGYAGVYGDTKSVPFYENFYGGGFASTRGFKDNTLGPLALQQDGDYDPIGGNIIFESGMELLFPLPFVKDQRSLRTSLFVDAGNVFDTNCATGFHNNSPIIKNCSKPDFAELRYSAGVGLTWITPMGPLTFSLAQALNEKSTDETQVFQFSLGTPF